jgi:hypothetical protein
VSNWHTLDINIDNAIQPNFNFDQLISTSDHLVNFNWDMWSYRYEQLPIFFREEWLDYMRSINLEISSVLLFYRQEFCNISEAHIDMPFNKGGELNCSINWVVGTDTGDMVWYDTVNEINLDKYQSTPANNKYITFPINELVEVDRHRIGSIPTLVRVDVPHTVQMNELPRWAVSARTKFKTNSWNSVLDYMKPYIKL